jgi:ribA/ribD-fused uncharacterized protein
VGQKGAIMISSFTGDMRFLSNFFEREIYFRGYLFQQSESAYQSEKDPQLRDRFLNVSAYEAKKLGKPPSKGGIVDELVPNWHEIKLPTMAEVVHCKYTQHRDIRKLLVDTYPHVLVEGNNHGDTFWGAVGGVGENWLGRINMAERAFWMDIVTTNRTDWSTDGTSTQTS